MKLFLVLLILLDSSSPFQSSPSSPTNPTPGQTKKVIHHSDVFQHNNTGLNAPRTAPLPEAPAAPAKTVDDVEVIKWAYIWGFPLVIMDVAEKQQVLLVNRFIPQSNLTWLDLSQGSVLLDIPANTPVNLELLNGWTKSISTYTQSGTPRKIAITYGNGVSEIPAGYEQLQISTKIALLKGQHEGVTISSTYQPKTPLEEVATMSGVTFFNHLLTLTRLEKYESVLSMHPETINKGSTEAFQILKEFSEGQNTSDLVDTNLEVARAVRAYKLFLNKEI
jgi:hypothetical protein